MLKLIIFLAAVAVCSGQLRYALYTKDVDDLALIPDGTIPTQYVASNPTIFLIHGFADNSPWEFNRVVREAILEDSDSYNIIEVDWIRWASGSYTQASQRVSDVALNLIQLIEWLVTGDANVEQFHLVGFDLGAHVAGIVGRRFNSEKIGRITGLNPSGRGWGAASQRLRSGDARYVEVIHTDTLGVLANGIGDPIGAVNFYPNGGNNQPGCILHSCCHARAFELFAASIEHELEGRKCNSMSQMNLNLCRGGRALNLGNIDPAKEGESGIYRINTSRRHPFL